MKEQITGIGETEIHVNVISVSSKMGKVDHQRFGETDQLKHGVGQTHQLQNQHVGYSPMVSKRVADALARPIGDVNNRSAEL